MFREPGREEGQTDGEPSPLLFELDPKECWVVFKAKQHPAPGPSLTG